MPESTPTPRLCPPGKWIDEPYRIFFPIGIWWSLVGVVYWIIGGRLPGIGAASPKAHVGMQIYGFMGSFVLGFLGTAIPRLTRTRLMDGVEVLLLLVLSGLTMLGVLREQYLLAHIGFAVTLSVFAVMLMPRLFMRKRTPPPTFLFVPFGILAGIVGGGLQAWQLGQSGPVNMAIAKLGSNLATQAFVLLLLVGVGGYLIRSILGWLEQAEPQPARTMPPRTEAMVHLLAAVLLLASFVIEALSSRSLGSGLKALVVTAELVWQLKVHRAPISGKLGSKWLRVAMWMLLAGLWADALVTGAYPQYRIALLHFCFVGGFAMSTLSVATRVILAHGGFPQFLRANFAPLSTAQALILLAALTRVSADFLPKSYQSHLVYASWAWCIGLGTWAAFLLYRVACCAPDTDAC